MMGLLIVALPIHMFGIGYNDPCSDSCVRVSYHTTYKCSIETYICDGATHMATMCAKEGTLNGFVIGNCIIDWEPINQ